LVEEKCWLIKPKQRYFAPQNISIHGIRPEHVRSAPTMQAIWPELRTWLKDSIIIAHNARFDIGVLWASLETWGIRCDDLQFHCTRLLAKHAWPGRTRYGLKPLGSWLGIHFRHHDALEDARCCAQIALQVARQSGHTTLSELETAFEVKPGQLKAGKVTNPKSQRSSGGPSGVRTADRFGMPREQVRNAKRLDTETILTASDRSRLPLSGKKIILLGTIGGMDRAESVTLVETLGGQVQDGVNHETDYVVACDVSLAEARELLASVSVPTGHSKARVLSQRQFRALLPAGKTATNW
jgi:DNA polymerase-3 subunit epsilon